MAQFECEICGAGFEQKSRHERHVQTSHPERAVSAADLERAVAEVTMPAPVAHLVDVAERRGQFQVADVLRRLPQDEVRDAAELSRAFGELVSKEDKPDHQPSVRGGERALEAPSAARLASLFAGLEFPVSARDIQKWVQDRGDAEDAARVESLPSGNYQDMAEVMRQVGATS